MLNEQQFAGYSVTDGVKTPLSQGDVHTPLLAAGRAAGFRVVDGVKHTPGSSLDDLVMADELRARGLGRY